MCCKSMSWKNIGVTSYFAYVKLQITWSIFPIPLDFDIARLTCIRDINLLPFLDKRLFGEPILDLPILLFVSDYCSIIFRTFT